MSEEKNKESVDNTGSSNVDDLIKDPVKSDDAGNVSGESKKEIDLEKYVEKDQYENLEKKLGEQGEEVKEYRDFIKDITPLMEKLDGKEEIVQAILDDKITPDLAKAVLDGKVSISDATKVADADKEVKKELGDKSYKELDPDKLKEIITDKVDKIVEEKTAVLDNKINESDERRDFEEDVKDFVKNTSDFDEYSEKIAEFFKENPKQYDIRVAYDVVRGKALAAQKTEDDEKLAAEKAKDLAGNASGGSSQGATIVNDTDKVDELIANSVNPNVL